MYGLGSGLESHVSDVNTTGTGKRTPRGSKKGKERKNRRGREERRRRQKENL